MPKTIYDEEEVYLTEEAVKHASGYERAEITYYLIKKLLDNGQSKTPAIDVILSRCAEELKPVVI